MEEPAKTGSALEHCVTKKYPTLICPSGYAQKVSHPRILKKQRCDFYTCPPYLIFSSRISVFQGVFFGNTVWYSFTWRGQHGLNFSVLTSFFMGL